MHHGVGAVRSLEASAGRPRPNAPHCQRHRGSRSPRSEGSGRLRRRWRHRRPGRPTGGVGPYRRPSGCLQLQRSDHGVRQLRRVAAGAGAAACHANTGGAPKREILCDGRESRVGVSCFCTCRVRVWGRNRNSERLGRFAPRFQEPGCVRHSNFIGSVLGTRGLQRTFGLAPNG